MRPALAMFAAATLLAACGRSQDATTLSPPPPADAPAPAAPTVDFTRPLNLLGTEPFWSLRIRADGLTYAAPDHDEVVATNPGPAVTGETAVWTGDAKGQPVKATLTKAACSDGMSDLSYPFKATVEIEGKVLEGCAGFADAMPKEGG